jgi:hypothetical protein
VFYCCSECQGQEWNQHKDHCKAIQKLIAKYKKSEFNTLACLSGGKLLDRERHEEMYSKGVSDLIVYYSCFHAITGSKQAVREALLIAFQYLQRIPDDPFTINDLLPDLFLRINQDQMAYDIIKWCYVHSDPYISAAFDKHHPMFDIYRADRSESSMEEASNPRHAMTFMHRNVHVFIKLRLYHHFVNLEAFYGFLQCIAFTSSSALKLFRGDIDILRYLRSCNNNLPINKFTNPNKDTLLYQVYESIREGETLRKDRWIEFISSNRLHPEELATFESGRIQLHPEDTHINAVDSMYEWWRRDPLIMTFLRNYVQCNK